MQTFTELLEEAHWHHQNRNLDKAAQIYRELLRLKPNHAGISDLLGRIRFQQARFGEALQLFEKACRFNPSEVAHEYSRGKVLSHLKRHTEAVEAFGRACTINPDYEYALSELARSSRAICDWSRFDEITSMLRNAVENEKAVINPFWLLNFADEPDNILACARRYLAYEMRTAPPVQKFSLSPLKAPGEKIRLAYMSADYREHAVTHLLSELIELHDRNRFEVIGISIGNTDNSPARVRIEKSFDRFYDALDWRLDELPRRINQLQPDILIDLQGHTDLNRMFVFASRPAPIQVNYLGYPGTSGADFFDYIIADPVIAPMSHENFYSEKIIQLPGCYQPNDRQRVASVNTPSRAEYGLPENGFVFASLNNCLKITPPVFDIWMRLLQNVPDSVLWIYANSDAARANLHKETAARGVDPARVIFASAMKLPDHLARHRLADLFLDTFPYTGHTTVSDALWMGLPVVTCLGNSFAARVSSSLVTTAEIPELVTHSFEEYERLAFSLARDPSRLGSIRARLMRNRDTCALFDTPRYCRNLEAAYETMIEIRRRGEQPREFSVSAQEMPVIRAAE